MHYSSAFCSCMLVYMLIYIIIIGQFGCLSMSRAHVIGLHGQRVALASAQRWPGIQAKNECSELSA